MDDRARGWVDRTDRTDRWIDGFADRQTDGLAGGWIDGKADRRMHGRSMYGQTDRLLYY